MTKITSTRAPLNKPKFECGVCNKAFRLRSLYEKHKKYHDKCLGETESCKKTVKEELQGKRKIRKEDQQTTPVESCNNISISWDGENNYFAVKSKQENRDSGNCVDSFDSFTLKTNIDKSDKERGKSFKCQECFKLFSKEVTLTKHIKTSHEKLGKLKCHICNEEFDTKDDFESHISLHGPEDKVICKGCKKVFDSLRSYQAHAKQYPGVHCFPCKLCLRQFPTELMLEQHVCIWQNGKALHCACGKEFQVYQDVIIHSKGTRPFHCCSCPHQSTSLTTYIRHLRKHSKQKPYQCTKCGMKFAVINFLNIHIKKHHSSVEDGPIKPEPSDKDSLKCPVCSSVFQSADELKKHEQEHECVQCPDCGKLLKSSRLESHKNTHKKSASLCAECGKLFDTRFKLTQHVITTHNSEVVKCEICKKVLKTRKILNEHMKTHLKSEFGEKIPQAICPQCGLGLAQKGSLARHILLTHEKHKIVHHDKTYTCQECSAVLPNRGKYYSHRRMHRAMIDRFPCEICGREFNKKQNLRRHIYLLHDEKRVLAEPIFKCQICTRCFREKKNLKRHYKMVHKLDKIM